MSNLSTTLLLLTVVLVLLPAGTYAFGAGEIPDFAYLHDKAFRHGDIENVLAELAKTAGHAAGSGGLFEFAHSILSSATGGSKFSSQDVKRVYFGNWLRDYSQAMDIAGLSKLTSDTLVLIVSILGFLTFGFATEEYQVTAERLGVYLPVEHIDNPKGYGEKEGDPRQFHPRLRPPVNPEELEIDTRTGMKKYMATEGRSWDTSTAHIRRTFRACIEHGRRAEGHEGADMWEAYRLLGTGLHTMEDLLAHSNWCELALRKQGHDQVFCHVGDDVLIETPNGEAPPLVTGTFGSADFLHSLMGEATDHLSQASVIDLTKNLENASQNQADDSVIRSILQKLPIGGGNDTDAKISEADAMKEKSQAYEFNPDDVAPPEVQQQLWELLVWRDGVFREVVGMIEMVPGLESLIDSLTNALNAYVYTVLAPYLTPILQQVTGVLSEGSKAVIDSDDQYEVFDNPRASDPSHSLLSKDHFGLILNEPAGKIAQVVVRYSAEHIVEAWTDTRINPDEVIDRILEAFHHPYFNVGQSTIQHQMFQEMESWVAALGGEEAERIIQALSKESVRAGKNKRQGAEDDMEQSGEVYGEVHGSEGQRQEASSGGYSGQQGGYGAQGQHNTSAAYGVGRNQQYSQEQGEEYGSQERQETESYRSSGAQGRRNDPSAGYGGGYNQEDSQEQRGQYGYQETQEREEYRSSESNYSSHQEREQSSGYNYGRSEDNYERPPPAQPRYQAEESTYSSRQNDEEDGYRPSYQPSYVEPEAPRRYGDYSEGNDDGYGRRQESRPADEYSTSENRYGGEERSAYGCGGGGGGDEYRAPSGFQRRENNEPQSGDYGEETQYGGGQPRSEYGGGGRRGGGEDNSYGRSGYGEEQGGRQQYGGDGGYAQPRGYGDEGGYQRQRESADETFGAEGLQISEGDEEERPHHHRHHHNDDY